MKGVKKGTVILTKHQSIWAKEYKLEARMLLMIFGKTCIDIQHIGSTSIPGLIAKPLIDIAIQVADFEKLNQIPTKLNAIGYSEKVGRLDGRQRVFAKSKNSVITHHLHIIEKNNPDWNHKINFKEILIKYPKVMQEYAELKKSLSAKYRNNRAKYTEGKSKFIMTTLERYT